MDGLTLAASVAELRALIGGKVEKIQQPEKYELLFAIHTSSGSKKLIISSSTENCRIHLTDEKRTSPIDAPNFLMLLRKHLLGARITAVEQPNLDRTVLIKFDAFTELHDSTCFTLACEIMGKYSNIILVDSEGNIVDAIRRVSASMSSVRLILPKLPYELPSLQEKIDPRKVTAEQIRDKLLVSDRPDKALSSLIYGLSPTVASLLIDHIENALHKGDLWLKKDDFGRMNRENRIESLSEAITEFYDDLLSLREKPCILKRGDKCILLPFTPCVDNVVQFSCLSEAADAFYRTRAEAESIHRRTASLEKVISNCIQRTERKAEKFALSIGDEQEIDRLRLYGELLTANMYALPARCREAVVENYYLDPPAKVVIPLDETMSPSDNAQQYYKKYRKAKSGREVALVMRKEALEEIDYLRGIYADLSQCLSDSDFDEIRSELAAGGYVRAENKKKVKLPVSKPYHFVSSDGFEIYVGKNNTQNDKLTFKTASPDDLWLHTKDIHGSHVIIRSAGQAVPDQTLLEAAQLAAYYSQARNSSGIPVDYAFRKFVKKPSGAKPGMVIYSNNKTVYITPDPSLADRLRR